MKIFWSASVFCMNIWLNLARGLFGMFVYSGLLHKTKQHFSEQHFMFSTQPYIVNFFVKTAPLIDTSH